MSLWRDVKEVAVALFQIAFWPVALWLMICTFCTQAGCAAIEASLLRWNPSRTYLERKFQEVEGSVVDNVENELWPWMVGIVMLYLISSLLKFGSYWLQNRRLIRAVNGAQRE